MDNDVFEYLSNEKVAGNFIQDNQAVVYERRISALCSSTVMTQVSWGMMSATIGEERHYEEL